MTVWNTKPDFEARARCEWTEKHRTGKLILNKTAIARDRMVQLLIETSTTLNSGSYF